MSVKNSAKTSQETIAGIDWVAKASRPATPDARSRKLSLVDLFSSCGGLSLGVWEAARIRKRYLDIRLAVDFQKIPIEVYRNNFLDDRHKVKCDDVARIFDGNKNEYCSNVEQYWKRKIGPLNLLVAGPPCQGHSDLNNSTRRNDPRNGLYLRVARAAEVLEPDVVIIENVPAVKHDQGKVVEEATNWLEAFGYGVSTNTIQLAEFGVPQKRKRHILVAVLDGFFDLTEFGGGQSPPAAGEFLSGLEKSANSNGLMSRPSQMTDRNQKRVAYLFKHGLFDLPNTERPSCHRDKDHAYVSMYGRMHWDKPAQTLTSGFGSMGQGRYVHPTEPRLLTPHEAARLQGIPDFFDFSCVKTMSSLREMIANAVPPQFTSALVAKLIDEGLL